MTDADFQAWAESADAIRCILVEVAVRSSGTETVRYLSSAGYVTGSADAPANTVYDPCIVGSISVSESLPLDGSASMAWGDIEIANPDGVRDSWINDVWSGRTVTVLSGDVRWVRSDFRIVFSGVVEDVKARGSDRLNLLLRDKSHRLNDAITETLLGGTGTNKNDLLPLCFGEVHNIGPLLLDAGTLKYMVHNGPIERIIEVRDNGVPVSFGVPVTSDGTFTLSASPVGTITASVQGAKPGGTYLKTAGALVKYLTTTFGKVPLSLSEVDTAQVAAFDAANQQTLGLYLDSRANLLETAQSIAASIGAKVSFTSDGKLQLLKVALPALGTPGTVDESRTINGSMAVANTPDLQPAVKLGYCRNYTVQDSLQTGLPAAHLDLYGREWLVVQVSDTTTATTWNMTTEPTEVDTLLQSRVEAEAEATRRLTLWSARHLVLGFSTVGTGILQPVGGALTVTHRRFGLSSGKTGQVIGKKTDWLSHKVEFEVLV